MTSPTAVSLVRALVFLAALGLVVLFAGWAVDKVKRSVPVRFPK